MTSRDAQRVDWERALPGLSGGATHWLLDGDGIKLGPQSEIQEILDIIEDTRHFYSSIGATPVRVAESGEVATTTAPRVEIWNRLNAEIGGYLEFDERNPRPHTQASRRATSR